MQVFDCKQDRSGLREGRQQPEDRLEETALSGPVFAWRGGGGGSALQVGREVGEEPDKLLRSWPEELCERAGIESAKEVPQCAYHRSVRKALLADVQAGADE